VVRSVLRHRDAEFYESYGRMSGVNRKPMPWELKFALTLIVTSAILNWLLFLFFRDLHHIWLWTLTSLAFLPISVLVVTVFIDRLLSSRDKAMRLEKLSMLIGAFYSVVGTHLLTLFAGWDANVKYLQDHFGTAHAWDHLDPHAAKKALSQHSCEVQPDAEGLAGAKEFLAAKIDFLLGLLENPSLLEHESFTELLRAVFHLTEELAYRQDVRGLPDSDIKHLCTDVKRCYGLLVREWVAYMGYLQKHYPYLFSLAVRTNPFDRHASVIVG
jgi:hypothetical protein